VSPIPGFLFCPRLARACVILVKNAVETTGESRIAPAGGDLFDTTITYDAPNSRETLSQSEQQWVDVQDLAIRAGRPRGQTRRVLVVLLRTAQVSESVFLIQVIDAAGQPLGTATGFLVAPDLVLSNVHGARAGTMTVHFGSLEVPCPVERVDVVNDLALCRMQAKSGTAPLRLSTAGTETWGKTWSRVQSASLPAATQSRAGSRSAAPLPAVGRTLDASQMKAMLIRVACGRTGDDEIIAQLQRIFRHALGLQARRGRPFRGVLNHVAIVVGHHDADKGVRISEIEFDEQASNGDALVLEVAGRERMVSVGWLRSGHGDDDSRQKHSVHGHVPPAGVRLWREYSVLTAVRWIVFAMATLRATLARPKRRLAVRWKSWNTRPGQSPLT